MSKKFTKMIVLLFVLSLLFSTALAGCASSTKKPGENKPEENKPEETPQQDNKPEETDKNEKKEEVVLWYLWSGVEGENLEKVVTDFNDSQDKYEVKGLSVPDLQKVTVAISSGNGPDVTDDFSSNVASYADKGIMVPLDEYIEKDNYDLDDFIPAALKSCEYDGKTYALPVGMNMMMLFYNKTLFAEAGISEPPKTDKELLDYAIQLTKVNSDKTIDVLGFPDFPFVYYVNPMTVALGGSYASEDGKILTPDNEGTINALKLLVEYRKEFGVDNVVKFQSAGKYLDPTDPFISGKQAMRIDGPWFGHNIKNVMGKTDLDYGVVPLPYPEGKSELEKSGEISASMFYIPATAKNKDGGWEFLKYICGEEGMKKFDLLNAGFPARLSLVDDKDFAELADFEAFADLAKSPNLKFFPALPQQTEYQKIISDQAELVANLKKTPEEAMKEAAEKAKELVK